MTTLQTLLPELMWTLPDLLAASAQVKERPPDPGLARLGLADERGLTRKGKATLTQLRALADLLDLPLA